jgi:hypothetical protein
MFPRSWTLINEVIDSLLKLDLELDRLVLVVYRYCVRENSII